MGRSSASFITTTFMTKHKLTNTNFLSNGSTWIFAALLHAVLLFGLPSFVLAASVDVEVIKGEAIVGEDLAFALKFKVESDAELIDVSSVQYNGSPIPYEVNSQSTSSFTMIVNGKTVRSSSDLVKTYIFNLPTVAVGPLEIPSFSVSVGDKKYKIKALTFAVTEKPTSDDLQFLVQVINPQTYYYPSQVVDLECAILYRNFPGSPAIENILLPILNNLNFELLPDPNPNFELIINGQRRQLGQQQGTKMYKGKKYNSLTFHLKFRMMNHGDFNFENSLKMIVETGKRYRRPSMFFGYDIVNETKPVYAESTPLHISVLELPQKNVPPSFNGAIGNFKIRVTPSSDTAIRVGDPITLLIEISGRGTWEFVKSPPIEKEPQITDYFIVSNDPVVGEVNEAETSKSFSVRLRVKSKTVTEIPAIPFTYFDLASRKYVTVRSNPVPIQVFEAAAPAQITDFGAPPPANPADKNLSDKRGPDGNNTVGPTIHQQNRGDEPLLPPLIQIADNVGSSETTKNHGPVYGKLLFAFLPLSGVFIFYLLVLYRDRDVSDEKNANLRSKRAYKKFVAELDHLSVNAPSFCSELGRSIHQFLENRYGCTLLYLSGETLRPLIEQNKISADLLPELVDLIEKVDQHRYGSTPLSQDEAAHLLKRAKEVMKKCD